jgi:Abnormal spindle-like microcephaly-assoc'd, ASPM-SPD-2-Hydin/Transmembrane protein 131-like N-terminal
MRLRILLVVLMWAISGTAFGQSGSMTTIAGLNTKQYGNIGATAAPDATIAVGSVDFCEHVNSAYQCWYKSGPNAFQPVNFLGGTSPKLDTKIWTQNGNNGGNTPNCGTAASPNAQLLHDNVYNKWILQKRIQSAVNTHEYMCVAVSNIDDVSQANFGWFAFEWDLYNVIPLNSHGVPYYPDYPEAGLWQTSTSATPPYTPAKDQALWITYDLQDVNNNDNTIGVLLCAVNLAGLETSKSSPYLNNAGTPACVVAHGLSPFTQRDNWVPANNSDTTPPISTDGEMFAYMIEPPHDGKTFLTDPNHTQGVEQWTIDWTASTPAPSEVSSWDLPSTGSSGDQLACFDAASYYNTVCVPQPSTATTGIYIDSVGDRLQPFFHYTANGGQGSVWTSAHAIQIVPNNVRGQTEADIRLLQWNSSTPPAISVAADYPMTDPNDPSAYVVLPSVARDRQGNLQGILGTSGPGTDQHPGLDSIYLISSTGSVGSRGYIANPATDGDAEDTDAGNYRWGDWYGAVLDPSDSCTVWVVGEFLPTNRTGTNFFWYTEIAELPPMNNCASANALVTLSAGSVIFGRLQVGLTSAPQQVMLTNDQTVALNIGGIATTGDFAQTNNCGSSLAAGSNCTINVTFTPTALGTRTGSLTVTDDAANNPQAATLIGTGVASAVTFSPASLTFPAQVLGTTAAAQTVTLTNTAGSSLTVNSVVASGNFGESNTCSTAIAPGQTCTIGVAFTPSVTGPISGVVTVNDTASGSPHMFTAAGSGVTPLSGSPTSIGFGQVAVGCGPPMCITAHKVTLANNSASSLNLAWSASGNFSAVGGSTLPCGTTLAAGSQCTLSVSFLPTAYGTIKGGVAIGYNGAYSPLLVGLSGVGYPANGSNPLTFSVPSLNMGNVVTGTTSPAKVVTVTNSSSSTVNISGIAPSGDFGITAAKTTCGGILGAAAKCTVGITVSPAVAGSMLGSLTFSDDQALSPQVLDISATGIWPVTLSPTSLTFSLQAVGTTSSSQTVTLTNNQATALTINGIVASGDYLITTASTHPCPVGAVASKATCNIGVAFSPTAAGTINGVVTVSHGAPASPQEVSLTGTAH